MRFVIYTLDDWGRALDCRMADAESVEAIKKTYRERVGDYPIEIWDGPRRVARLQRSGGRVQVFD
jgi:hypothetical protein